MPRLVPLLVSGLLVAILPAGAATMAGRMEGERYFSATGEFSIPVPVLAELGGTIEDSETVVTFHDNFNTHVSIACIELDSTQRWEFETRGLRDYLLYFFNDLVLANFEARYPGSKIESARYLPELLNGSLITFATLPGGSSFEDSSQVLQFSNLPPVIAKRGTLLFVRRRHVFVVTIELAERATQRSTYHLTPDQENEQLSARLTTLVGRMTFTRDQPRSP